MAEEEAEEGGEGAAEEEKKGLPIKLILIVVGVLALAGGGYFAYTKGYLDTIISKVKGGGGSAYTPPTSQYKPFTSKLPPQGGAQQAPQQNNPFQRWICLRK